MSAKSEHTHSDSVMDLRDLECYHGFMSGAEAEALLADQPSGAFLLRRSPSHQNGSLGTFTLSFKKKADIELGRQSFSASLTSDDVLHVLFERDPNAPTSYDPGALWHYGGKSDGFKSMTNVLAKYAPLCTIPVPNTGKKYGTPTMRTNSSGGGGGGGGDGDGDKAPAAATAAAAASKSDRRGSRPDARRPTKENMQPLRVGTLDVLMAKMYGFKDGMLVIQILETRGTKAEAAATSGGGVYATVEVEGVQQRSAPTTSTQIEAEMIMNVSDTKQKVRVSLMSKKKLGKDVCVGAYEQQLSSVADGKFHRGWFALSELESLGPSPKATGDEVYMIMQFITVTNLNRDFEIAERHGDRLREILLARDLVVVCSLCTAYESEDLSKTLIRVFNEEGQAVRLLVQLVYRDLKRTTTDATVFRKDSMATKTARNYFNVCAPDYLRNVVGDLVDEVLADSTGLEVDPRRGGGAHNVRKLVNTVETFLQKIINSLPQVPKNMRLFFAHLRTMLEQCFPNAVYQGMGALIFLRYTCPAVTNPRKYGLVEETISDRASRDLLLIIKVMQQVVSGVTFKKEECMLPVNEYLSKMQPVVRDYLDRLSAPVAADDDAVADDAPREPLTDAERTRYLALVVGHIQRNLSIMEKEVAKDPRVVDETGQDRERGALNRKLFEQLKDILKEEVKE